MEPVRGKRRQRILRLLFPATWQLFTYILDGNLHGYPYSGQGAQCHEHDEGHTSQRKGLL